MNSFVITDKQTNTQWLKKTCLHIKEIPLFSFVMTDNIKEIPLFSFVMTDSFVMTENIKEIPLFSFVMNSFVMTDKQTNKQIHTQTESIA